MDHIVVQSVTVPPASSSLGVDAPEAAKEGEMRVGELWKCLRFHDSPMIGMVDERRRPTEVEDISKQMKQIKSSKPAG